MMRLLLALAVWIVCALPTSASPFGKRISWDARSLLIDGRRVCPVMGEIHYSRVPQMEWAREVRKMKEGGVTIISTYVFWNHIEEIEGQYDWSGQRDLRSFLEVCQREEMPVVLRIGPYCHGEVRNGGIPDWLFKKKEESPIKMRSEDSRFLHYVERLYRQIFTQVQGLQWKDGGPVIAVQFDNEYRGRGEYLMSLKRIALSVGFDLPFYTRTGWPELSTPVPFGEMIPLYGDYADGFWDKDIKEGAGDYWKAFHFKAFRSSTAIGTDVLGDALKEMKNDKEAYPYFTCELGGGMVTAYHKRPYMYPEDALSMAIVKLGSGSNLLGYYMYHGGTNPEGKLTTLNENQRTLGTANNDLPVKSYEFQAPLGEFGQRTPVYYRLRPLHLMLNDFGELLAGMDVVFSKDETLPKRGDDTKLRWTYRTDGERAFVFVNNYERFANLTAKRGVQFDVCGVKFPRREMTIPASCMAVFPVKVAGLDYATAQLLAIRGNDVFLMQVPGVPTEMRVGGKIYSNMKPKGMKEPVCRSSGKARGKRQEARNYNYYLLNAEDAEKFELPEEMNKEEVVLEYKKIKECGALREVKKGPARVAEAPCDDDFEQAAVYVINLPESREERLLLDIEYQGDCARLYANGKLLDDNFYNGRHFQYGLWRLPEDVRQLELRILPLQADAPIYLPREADKSVGEKVVGVKLKMQE